MSRFRPTERERQARAYERELGPDASARQQAAATLRFVCCGELIAKGHHPACSNRPQVDVEKPEPAVEQRSLL